MLDNTIIKEHENGYTVKIIDYMIFLYHSETE